MKTPPTNLKVLKKTRRKPEKGDIFAFQLGPLADRYFFGRVIATDTKLGDLGVDVTLIYLYRASSSDRTIIPALRNSELLVPPIGTNSLAWSRGFFEFIESRELRQGDVLPQHCFHDLRDTYVDEYGNRLPGPVEPVGIYGLSGIGAIDHELSRALGLSIKTG